MKKFLRFIWLKTISLVNIWEYIDHETADSSIRKNIAFKGPNVIILACAIVIASVGLNVNSIPVIIGAMLISPVMGPILGFGLGLGKEDKVLMKDSLKNFVVMVVISIIASSIYFLLSPLNLENQSELLARTNPTIYDVLIALFGGFAGILETSRKEKGTVISGVAIATALMPPLCTVGYGISELNFTYIGGALYLFIINSIFIALATFMAVKLFKFPKVETAANGFRRFSKFWYILILIVVIAPSVVTAINVVRENNFKIHSDKIVGKNKKMGNSYIIEHKVNYTRNSPVLEVTIMGETLSDDFKEVFYRDAAEYGIDSSQVIFKENITYHRADISEAEILKGIYEHSDNQIKNLNDSIVKLNARLLEYKNKEIPAHSIALELFSMNPNINNVSITRGSIIDAETKDESEKILVYIESDGHINENEYNTIERWLKVRLGNDNVMVLY